MRVFANRGGQSCTKEPLKITRIGGAYMAVVQHGHSIGYESRLRTEGKSHLPNKDSQLNVNYKGVVYE